MKKFTIACVTFFSLFGTQTGHAFHAQEQFFLKIKNWSSPKSFLSASFLLDPLLDPAPENFKINSPHGMPCDGVLSSEFGWRRLGKQGRMHEGIDIAAPVGTPVVAPAEGTVVFAGHKGGYGLTVVLEHDGKFSTLYGHNSELFVKTGDVVQKGQGISLTGNTGHSTGPHLHYEVHKNGEPVDPINFI